MNQNSHLSLFLLAQLSLVPKKEVLNQSQKLVQTSSYRYIKTVMPY